MFNKIIKIFFLGLIGFLFSCKLYRQDYMFVVDDEIKYDSLKSYVNDLDFNYKISSGDLLGVNVYTSNGEMLIDPENQFNNSISGSSAGTNTSSNSLKYLVNPDGRVNLPMVGRVKLDSLTLLEADSMLQSKYNEFYTNSFVKTTCENRRVIVLGAMGGKVIPLENENMNLIEVLALAGGLDEDAKARNIRLIRGELNNPQVAVIDLSTIEGMKASSLRVQNHDIIYVEPVKRTVREATRDFTPVVSLLTSILTIFFILGTRSK